MKKKILVKNSEERKKFLNDLAKVPQGPYCYTIVERLENGSLKCEYCPFLESIQMKNLKEQNETSLEFPEEWVSRCRLTGVEDDLLLNDSCKVCDVNCDYRNGNKDGE